MVFCLTPWSTPPLALAIGVVVSLTIGHPWPAANPWVTRYLLQGSVIGLGFGINLQQVVAAGRIGLLFTMVSIAATVAAGYLLGRALRVRTTTAHLISAGTAICGGSAIAAVGPVAGATDEEMSVSLGTVFILNAVALLVFPPVGMALGLTQSQFGVWAGMAIHDTSSVIGAAARYGAAALEIATPVKLARALWIVPLTLFTAAAFRRKGFRLAVPWFIVLFLAASVLRTYAAAPAEWWSIITAVARKGLTVTLFLIGAGLSRAALRAVGPRALVLGVILWIAVSAASLLAAVGAIR